MKRIILSINVFFLILYIISTTTSIAKDSNIINNDINPGSWTYVDALGRTDESYEQISDDRKEHDRYVGIFYHTWHTEFSKLRVPVNMTEVVNNNPEAAIDVKNNDFWYKNFERKYQPGYFWNEPIFGYYDTLDEYVLRKHAELLADAGVDFIFIDWTNGEFTWEKGTDAILKVFKEAREDGVDAPQIVFWISLFEPQNRINQITTMYERWYSNPEYDDMWFKLDGKPLVLGYSDILGMSYTNSTEIKNMFTFRSINPSYFNYGGIDETHWGWLSVYPQCKYGTTEDGRPEEMAVGVAQNANSDSYTLSYMAEGDRIMGRSFAALDEQTKKTYFYSYNYAGKEYIIKERNDLATKAGRNFQQQWDYAIECDPNVVLVTGWNEWTSYRNSGFCDAFTDEYSRDIEPTKGDLKDNYYYQLVSNVRRYKGIEESEWNKNDKKTIDIYSNDLSQWDDITSYNHYTRSTRDRDCKGYKQCKFENFTMRNDIVTSKVAYDKNNFYFYVSTLEDLTAYTDKGWMRLFIDTDYTGLSDNWEGFEFVINRINPTENTCTLEKSEGISENGEWLWKKISDKLNYSVKGNILQIEVPKKLLGFDNKFDFSFKWSDNMQSDGDIMDFYSNGDVAPGGRFCFRFQNIKNHNNPLVIYITIIVSSLLFIAITILLLKHFLKKSKQESA